eukprot:COSAG06_NODE_756_length_12531_cov_76.395592_3_plen_564_part_00
MGLLACRGPVHAPSLVWGAELSPSSTVVSCGAAVPQSPRPPSGRRPQTTAGRCHYDLRYDPTRPAAAAPASPSSTSSSTSLSTARRDGSFGSSRSQLLEKEATIRTACRTNTKPDLKSKSNHKRNISSGKKKRGAKKGGGGEHEHEHEHHHRMKVVHPHSHYRSEQHELLQGPQVVTAAAAAHAYAPVYFALPGFPGTGSGVSNGGAATSISERTRDRERGMDKWDSARLLRKSRPVAAVLRHIDEQRSLHAPAQRSPRVAPLFDRQGNPVPAAAAAVPAAAVLALQNGGRGRGSSSSSRLPRLSDQGSTASATSSARSIDSGGSSSDRRYHRGYYAAAAAAAQPPRSAPVALASSSSSSGLHHQGGGNASNIVTAAAAAAPPPPVGYNPVYICDSSGSKIRTSNNNRLRPATAPTPPANGYSSSSSSSSSQMAPPPPHYRADCPNHTAFMVSTTGREGRRAAAAGGGSSRGRYGYHGVTGRPHCRALYSSQAGYTLGWVRRRHADEHAAAARIQACFRGRYVALPCLALPCLALPCLALPCLALPCLALPCLALQHHSTTAA